MPNIGSDNLTPQLDAPVARHPEKRSVLVTGAGTGFGRSTALLLAARGFRVYGTVQTGQREDLEKAALEHGVELRVLDLDVTRAESVASAVGTVVAESGGVFAVVNCAGVGLRGFFEDLSDEEIRTAFDVNFFGVLAVTRAVLPHMRSAGEGRIVMMSSAGGRIAAMTLSGYCAGKFALEGFSESLALETAACGVVVSILEPGLVATPHFTVHRGRAKAALDPGSPYRVWFSRHEALVDEILETGRITSEDVASAVHRALSARRPRRRYVVGWRPKLLVALRRLLPDLWFDRLYLRESVRRVSMVRRPESHDGPDRPDWPDRPDRKDKGRAPFALSKRGVR
jgi:NAD(P)-dependent dehydrogenase (short-subunit alcohol dehydrogenase family)